MAKAPFLGGYGVGRSTSVEDSQLVNLYLEMVDGKDGREPGAFYMTPGLTSLLNVCSTATAINGMHVVDLGGDYETLYVIAAIGGSNILFSYNGAVLKDLGKVGVSTNLLNGIIDNGPSTSSSVSAVTITAGGTGYTSAPSVTITDTVGSGLSATVSVSGGAVTGVSISNHGSGYVSPAITFTGGGGSGATGHATIVGGEISTITVTNGGTGYATAPTVHATDPSGSGATATATVYGPVSSITTTAHGSGYSTSPTITINDPTGTGATAVAVIGSATVTGLTVAYQGAGYTSAPTVTISGGGGTGATATAALNGSLNSVTMTAPGNSYTSTPTVSFSGGGGSGATATALLSGQLVYGISITNGGSGYTSAPTVSFSGGGGSSAAATATISGPVGSLTITAAGSGFTSAPTVTISGGGGTGATATASITGQISSITLKTGGSGYSSPTVSITDPTGTSATATAAIDGVVSTVTITDGGTGYVAAANQTTVSFSGGGGSGATATATISNIGGQVAIYGFQQAFVVESGSVYPVTLPFTFPSVCTYQDGFGLVGQLYSNIFWQTNLGDLSTIDPLDFSSADATPSDIVALAEKQREIWIFKTESIEVWVDAGLEGFSFQRLEGVFIEVGCAAPCSVSKSNDSLIWLSKNTQGQGQIMMATGYQPERISTHAIETQINSYSEIGDAISYVYQQEGHEFYVITFPTGNATWVYDVAASKSAGQRIWHQRASGSDGSFTRHPGNAYAFFSGMHLIGSYNSGNVYYYDLTNATDNGTSRQWLRTFRGTQQSTFVTRRYDSLQVDMQTGINTSGSPTAQLSWADDGGNTWTTPISCSVGTSGQTAAIVKFNRLGSTRRNSGLDRIFKLTSTLSSSTYYDVALIGASVLP